MFYISYLPCFSYILIESRRYRSRPTKIFCFKIAVFKNNISNPILKEGFMVEFDPKKLMLLKKKLDVASAKFDERINQAIKGSADIDVISKSFFRMNGASANIFAYMKPYLNRN